MLFSHKHHDAGLPPTSVDVGGNSKTSLGDLCIILSMAMCVINEDNEYLLSLPVSKFYLKQIYHVCYLD